MSIELNAAQKRDLENIWFVFGNYGRKHTPGNHRFIQYLLAGFNYQKFYSPTPECVRAVEQIINLEMVETRKGGKKKSGAKKNVQEYRLHTDSQGRLRILPVPATGEAAIKFHSEIRKIAKELFTVGAALDSICGSHGELIFQHPDRRVNELRISQIIKLWKERKKQ